MTTLIIAIVAAIVVAFLVLVFGIAAVNIVFRRLERKDRDEAVARFDAILSARERKKGDR